ncbi:pentatricopeptide repeat-containing protein At5g08510-like [Silene latifolia]|uniref:pentatricopeptide repeat-containing protein At5g08510-like n=1 Tax=Silene latifolia TaxID=37657 RepID=UPI003D76F0B2
MWLRKSHQGLKPMRITRQFSGISSATLNQMMRSSGGLTHLRHLFDEFPTSRNLVSWNILIAGYVRHGCIPTALHLFDEMRHRDIVTWNTLFSAFQNKQDYHSTFQYYRLLQSSGFRPNHYTFSIVITSFLVSSVDIILPQIHAQIVSLGYSSNAFVGSALIRGYTKLGDHSALCCVFRDILEKSVPVWNAFILGLMDLGLTLEAHRAFNRMPRRNVVSWTILIDGFLKNDQFQKARYIFDKMDEKNIISWTAMISGYVRLGKYFNALELFPVMIRSGTRPNQHTFSSILAACAKHSELLIGEQLHTSILKYGITDEIVVLTALVGMYAKCGNIDAAHRIFKTLPEKTLPSWNTIIGGFAMHGLARRAVNAFEEMTSGGIRPDQTTFVHVLSACGHGGEVLEGERIFVSMEKTYGIPAEKEHYACMVDLYGRAGLLDKALSFIKGMPLQADVVVWGALLGSCAVHSDSEFSSNAVEAVLKLENDNPAVYSLLSKIYGEKGVWSSVTYLKNKMKENNIKIHKAGSWIG